MRPIVPVLFAAVLASSVDAGAQSPAISPPRHPAVIARATDPVPDLRSNRGEKPSAERGKGDKEGVTTSASVEPIADNSFLIEEAYNQEPGVVQHISTFTRLHGSNVWGYSLTQEWPAPSQAHQLSYTIPMGHVEGFTGATVGDVMLNYRYQLVDDEASGWAVSPRLSLQLPTGDVSRGMGLGGAGWQVNLPVSKTIGASVVMHLNVGGTYVAHESPALHEGRAASFSQLFVGQSLIWLAHPRFNVMLEALWSRSRTTVRGDGTTTEDSMLLVPGFRTAFDLPGDLQIVPGLGFPIGVGPSQGLRQTFVYLSFEHPFRTVAK